MPLPLIAAAGAGYLLLKKKGGMKKMLNISKGPMANIIRGIGVGTLVNVADKKFLGGTISRVGIPLGQTVNGKPLTINGSDAITYFATTGGVKLKKSDLMQGGVAVAGKKIAEAYDWIDPPSLGIPSRIAALNTGVSYSGSPGMIASGVPNLNLTS